MNCVLFQKLVKSYLFQQKVFLPPLNVSISKLLAFLGTFDKHTLAKLCQNAVTNTPFWLDLKPCSFLPDDRWGFLQMLSCIFHLQNMSTDIRSLTGDKIPNNIDLMTYSFPCQDLSNVGAFHGYNKGIDKDSGSRSSLLWQVGRILEEMRQSGKRLPRFLLMENVPALLYDRHRANFNVWMDDLNKMGYINQYYHLNASDFGLPQNRPRLLMISVFCGNDTELMGRVQEYFFFKKEADVIADYKESPYYNKFEIKDLLRTDYSNRQLFEEACECTPNDTVSRRKIWEENPQLVLEGNTINPEFDVVRTITTKQDRNPNSGNLYFNSGINGKASFRYLTPRECFLFMGFTDRDYDNVIKYNPEVFRCLISI